MSLAFVRGIHRWPVHRASGAENVSIWWRHHHLQAFSKARDLRHSAAAQRNQIPELQAKVTSYQQEKSRLETELQNKRQELGEWQ